MPRRKKNVKNDLLDGFFKPSPLWERLRSDASGWWPKSKPDKFVVAGSGCGHACLLYDHPRLCCLCAEREGVAMKGLCEVCQGIKT